MTDDLMRFDIPSNRPASIKVIGVGGGGGNAVNHMFEQGIKDVDFILCNTDAQALAVSNVPIKIQLGVSKTRGRGAGNNPEKGKEAAEENLTNVEKVLSDNTQMVFITAGMGGGTGTGAAPIIAELARNLNILTVGVVTVPFRFEGPKRINQALKGIEEMQQYVDSLLIINNEKLREMYGDLSLSNAFAKADDVLSTAVRGIAEIITIHGKVNVDFADVQTVMTNSGICLMGSGKAEGENRAKLAIEEALTSPLLSNANIRGTKNILLNITCGIHEVTMDEVSDIIEHIQGEVGIDVDIIWGYAVEPSLEDNLSVTIIATGFALNTLPDFSTLMNQPVEQKTFTKVSIEEPEQKQIQPLELVSIKQVNTSIVNEDIVNQDFTTQTQVEFETYEKGNDVYTFPTPKPEQHINLLNKRPQDFQQNNTTEIIPTEPQVQSLFDYETIKQLDDITEFENVPAFKRKGNEINATKTTPEDTEVSRFTLTDTKDGVKIKERNTFIHDNVD